MNFSVEPMIEIKEEVEDGGNVVMDTINNNNSNTTNNVKDEDNLSEEQSPNTEEAKSPWPEGKKAMSSLPESPGTTRTDSPRTFRTESPTTPRTDSPRISRTESPRINRTDSPRINRTDSPITEDRVKLEHSHTGIMTPVETATLLLLSRIALFNKKAGLGWGGPGGDVAPPGGVAGAGLAQWMSVMAEHMNQDPAWNSPFLWPPNKINPNNQPKGAEGGRLDPGHGMPGLYHTPRPESSSSASPPIPTGHPGGGPPLPGGGMLVVPQPINATKMYDGFRRAQGGEPWPPGSPPSPEMGGSFASGPGHFPPHHQMNGGPRKYQCKMCVQIFTSKADLQLHTQVHMREPKPYKCSQCSKCFANSSYLSQHMRIHLGIKPYRCEICQRKFTQLSHLQQHIRTHTGDKPYKCRHTGCTKAFSQLSNLQSHSRCHQTDKPYKCNSCYKCFHDEVSLLEHIPKHKESKHLKTHICSYCGKSYTQETYLAKHMQKHADRTDKRPPIVAAGTIGGPPGPQPTSHLSGLSSPSDPYWPKMDPGAYSGYAHQMMDQRLPDPRDYDPRGLHPGAHHNTPHNIQSMGEDLRQHPGSHIPTSWNEHTSSPSPNTVIKTTSAFSPLQSGMLHSSAGFGMPSAARGYHSFYDPIPFPQAPPKVNFGEPSTSSSNPSFAGPQLLSLSKIRNYAHNPHNDGLFKSLQEKAANHSLGQLGTAQ